MFLFFGRCLERILLRGLAPTLRMATTLMSIFTLCLEKFGADFASTALTWILGPHARATYLKVGVEVGVGVGVGASVGVDVGAGSRCWVSFDLLVLYLTAAACSENRIHSARLDFNFWYRRFQCLGSEISMFGIGDFNVWCRRLP